MVLASNLGFPRIGAKRELKKALESYWRGESDLGALLDTGAQLRKRHWQMQKEAGITAVPVGDFSYYDQVLDMSCLLGAVPERYGWSDKTVDMDTYFAMARGRQDESQDVTAMEMTKWFDTNYHYIVPELGSGQMFEISSNKIFEEFLEAREAGFDPVPVLIGPVTYLSLAKSHTPGFDPVSLIDSLIPVYAEILNKLKGHGAERVQMDEPFLAMDLSAAQKQAYELAYNELEHAAGDVDLLVTTYFEGLRDNLDLAFSLPFAALHIDLVRAPDQFEPCLAAAVKTGKGLSLGLVDGRNVWKNDLSASLEKLEKAKETLGDDKVFVAPSCSLLHVPIDLDNESKLDQEIKNWMAFARQKLDEVAILARGATQGRESIKSALADSDAAVSGRRTSPRIHNKEIKARLEALTPEMAQRQSAFTRRRELQKAELGLPSFPTTTIGSYPQTQEIRQARAAFRRGELDEAAYTRTMHLEIERVVRFQEEAGIDVLVHGEPERNDMVEYFGEQLDGFVFSKQGWVQSYGSRYVKPPIIFGDVARPQPMTVKWAEYAQSLTDKPMKGMLTGPITIMCWSFVRDDQPRETTCRQIALAIRDEVADLEQAGIKIIQIDEAAIREGLPLRRDDWKTYLDWAVESFRLSSCAVADKTQIHTHMCYSEFNDMIESIGAMDADVISIETSRSQMELLQAFASYQYPNEIGPGVYDIHSPRVPETEEMTDLLDKAAKVIAPDQLWVNPDCGLKTRGWAEVTPALEHMVAAAKNMRAKFKDSKAA